MKKSRSIVAWVLIIAMIVTSNAVSVFADSFDLESLSTEHIEDDESGKYYDTSGETELETDEIELEEDETETSEIETSETETIESTDNTNTGVEITEEESLDIATESEIDETETDDEIETQVDTEVDDEVETEVDTEVDSGVVDTVATDSELNAEIATKSELELVALSDKLLGAGEHSHKICGVTGACTHRTDILPGTNTHTNIDSWFEANSEWDIYEPSNGNYFYLTKNETIKLNSLYVSRDIYICLNGFTATLQFGVNIPSHTVYFTNCAGDAFITINNGSEIDNKTEIYGVNNNITCKYQNNLVSFSSSNEYAYFYSVNFERQGVNYMPDILTPGEYNEVILEKVELSNPIGGACFISAEESFARFEFIDVNLDFGGSVRSQMSIGGNALFYIKGNGIIVDNIINFRGTNVIKNVKLKNINLINKLNDNEFEVNILDGTTTFSDITMLNPDSGTGPRDLIYRGRGYNIPEGAALEFKNIDMTNDVGSGALRHILSMRDDDTLLGGLVVDGCKSNDPFGTMIRLPYPNKFNIGGDKICIANNINANDNTEAVGVYVDSNREAEPIINVAAGKTINSDTYISNILFADSINNLGHIVDGWTALSGGRDCEDVFTAYAKPESLYKDLAVKLREDNVVIGYNHNHKICGATVSCAHTTDVAPGTDAHDLIDTWEPLYLASDLIHPSKGPYFYLTNDITLSIDDTVTRDTYICLNGYSLTYGSNISTDNKVYITNCKTTASIVDSDYEIKTNTGIYGLNNNINYEYGHYIVHTENSASQSIYLYDVNFIRTGLQDDEDFRIGNDCDNSFLTLEKVVMNNCVKNNNNARFYTAASRYVKLSIIDSTFDYANNTRKTVEAFFHADTAMYYNAIDFIGNNVFKNLKIDGMGLFSVQGAYGGSLPNFGICVKNGTTTFKDMDLVEDRAKNFINNVGDENLIVEETGTLEILNIKLTNWGPGDSFYNSDRFVLDLGSGDKILGNLTISGCVSNGDFARIVNIAGNYLAAQYIYIGSGKIRIVNNTKQFPAEPATGVFTDDNWVCQEYMRMFQVEAGKTLNPETRIEEILASKIISGDYVHQKPIGIVDNWSTVSGGADCKDLFTASHYYGADVNVSLIDNKAKIADKPHVHKVCGTTLSCTHRTDIIAGTNTHTNISTWKSVSGNVDLDTEPSKYLFLKGNTSMIINYPDTQANPVNYYICLNGYNLTLTTGIKVYGKVHITNCGANASVDFGGSSYDPIKAKVEMYGVNNNIVCKYQQRVLLYNSGYTYETAYLYSVDLERTTSLSDYPDISSQDQNSTIVLEKVRLSNPVGGGSFIHAGSTPGTYYLIDTNLDFGGTERYIASGGALFNIYENSSLTNNVINFSGNNVIKNLDLKNINLLNKMNQNEFAVNVLDGTTTFRGIALTNSFASYGEKNFINKTLGLNVSEGASLEFKYIDMINDFDPGETRYLLSLGTADSIEGSLVIDGCMSNGPYGKMINLESGQSFRFGGDKVFIGNNININDNTEAAGIYVNANRGDTSIINLYDGKTINSETYISGIVFPDNPNYFGNIVNNWNLVSGGRSCEEVFTAYNKGYYNGLAVMLKDGNAVIGYDHEHKICGATLSCTHTTDVVPDTNTHVLIDTWEPLFEQIDLTNYGKGPYFYLLEDKTLTLDSLNRDIYICLNGHSLTYGSDISNSTYKVYITNCGATSNIRDVNHEIKTNTEIYGVNNNINYQYGHYIVSVNGTTDQIIYLYDISFQRTGNDEDEDFRLGNNSNNSVLTLEKVKMINCYKVGNNHTRLYSACSYDGVLNIIDSTFDFNNRARYGPEDWGYTVESLFQADFDENNFRRNIINFRGDNVFKNLELRDLNLFATQNSYDAVPQNVITGVNNFSINIVNGTTAFKNLRTTGNSTKNLISNFGETTGGHLTINEGATLEINDINTTNYIMKLDFADRILGNLIISDCVSYSEFGKVIYVPDDPLSVPRLTIGNGKIQIVNNKDGNGNPGAGIFTKNPLSASGNLELFTLNAGATINPETKIEGILNYYNDQYNKPIMLVRDFDTVSGGSFCQDLYTAYYGYGQNVGVRLVDGHAKIAETTSYTISFRDRDGNPLPGISDQTVTEGVKLEKCTPSITPKQEFKGWYKDLTDESTKWNFDVDRATESCTLYANIINHYTYNLSYNANGGVGHMDDRIDAPSGTAITLDANTYTRVNYKFIGWASASDATAADWIDGDTTFTHEVLIDEETYTIYAVWQKYVYTLHYDLQGGIGTIADVTDAGSGDNITLSTIRPTKTNATFLGWSDNPGQTSNPQYLAGGTYTATVDTDGVTKNIYAVWNPMYEYTISFNPNGGSGLMSDITATSSIVRTLPSNAFTRSDYTFLGWSENSAATSATYTSSITKTVDTSGVTIVLYAIWQYNGGGGGGGSSGGSSSGGGSGGPMSSLLTMPNTIRINQIKTIKEILLAETGEWNYDPIRNKWRYSANNILGVRVNARDGFYFVANGYNPISNNNFSTIINETYYFDSNGDMFTGFVVTLDNKTYFFDTQLTSREGAMVLAWKYIVSDWYYFGIDGAMYVNTYTPDGYFVGADGKWKQ